MTLTTTLLLAFMLSPAAVAGEIAGCWEGSVGSGPPTERQAFIEFADGAMTLTIADGEPKQASGPYVLANDTIEATLIRKEREIAVRLSHNPETGGLEGSLTHPDAGVQPLRLVQVGSTPTPELALGPWSGTLEAVGLPLVLRVRSAPCDRLSCVLDSPSQGASGMPCTSFALEGRTLRFGLSFISAEFEGTIDPSGTTLAGTFRQGGALPLVFTRGESAAPVNRPQEPKPPFPYGSEEVTIESPAADITLAGTLTVPAGDGPHPLAIFITGSGPQNRDEELMNHKPFLLLADVLTRAGIAVLRTDDRGVGGSGGDTLQSTLGDVAQDVIAQIEWARARPEIDAARVGLLGHSEGGWVAPLVENRVADLAFLVFIAGPGVGGSELLEMQTAKILEVAGAEPDVTQAVVEYNSALYKVLRKRLSDDETVARTVKAWAKLDGRHDAGRLASIYTAMQAPRDAVADHVRSQLGVVGTPWFRHLLGFDPTSALKKVDVPVLAVLGEKDVQVPAEANAVSLRAALRAADRRDVRIEIMPGLNHLMQQAETGSILEYGMIEETINPTVLELIESWVSATVGLENAD